MPLDCGAIGEIEAMSASLMTGYLPEAANVAAFNDGWYRTGDVGWIEPEGWVHLTDRAKEMIKVKGFQVAPAEIEAVLHGHAAVADCAVFGIDDARAGALQADQARRGGRSGAPPPLGQGAPASVEGRVVAAAELRTDRAQDRHGHDAAGWVRVSRSRSWPGGRRRVPRSPRR